MHTPLTSSVFYILLALSLKDRHGYEIMKQVEEDSGSAVRLGPGTLYTAIRRLLDDGWIGVSAKSDVGDERRKTYRLTAGGKKILSAEMERLEHAASLTRARLRASPRAA